MGFGGYLAWTAVVRELIKTEKVPQGIKIQPCEGDGKNVERLVRSPVFENNPHIYKNDDDGEYAFPLFLNNPITNYCKSDTPLRAHHRYDKHIIEQMCEFYEIENPELKCELYFSEQEEKKIEDLTSALGSSFITIEPCSKMNYTPNRAYPHKKWQEIVDALRDRVEIVQVGHRDARLLDGVVDYRGITSFRTAAGIIGKSQLFLSTEGGLVHAATAVDTKSIVIITGYQHPKMVAYPQNININLDSSNHGPCGLKVECPQCKEDRLSHNSKDIVEIVKKELNI